MTTVTTAGELITFPTNSQNTVRLSAITLESLIVEARANGNYSITYATSDRPNSVRQVIVSPSVADSIIEWISRWSEFSHSKDSNVTMWRKKDDKHEHYGAEFQSGYIHEVCPTSVRSVTFTPMTNGQMMVKIEQPNIQWGGVEGVEIVIADMADHNAQDFITWLGKHGRSDIVTVNAAAPEPDSKPKNTGVLTVPAREALQDIVTHYEALMSAMDVMQAAATANKDNDSHAYWEHEKNALSKVRIHAHEALVIHERVTQ